METRPHKFQVTSQWRTLRGPVPLMSMRAPVRGTPPPGGLSEHAQQGVVTGLVHYRLELQVDKMWDAPIDKVILHL